MSNTQQNPVELRKKLEANAAKQENEELVNNLIKMANHMNPKNVVARVVVSVLKQEVLKRMTQ